MTNNIEISDGEEAEYLICVRLTQPLTLPDNLIDLCCKCGEAIQHRPHVPKRPKKVCMDCMMPDVERQARSGELQAQMTPESAAEFAEFLRKKNAN